MARLNGTIKKLQTALIIAGKRVKINTRQFYSEEQDRMVTCYSVATSVFSEEKGKMADVELLKTCSTVSVVKYLAEMLEGLRNGTDN